MSRSSRTRMVAVCGFPRAGCSALITGALLAVGNAAAADLELYPVRIELSSQQKTAAITLRNTSDRPISVQIEVAAWSQVAGQDVFTASRELLVSPPLATLPARGEQVIRAALRRPVEATSELSYRISLRQLPALPSTELGSVPGALRIAVPAFVQPSSGPPLPQMVWGGRRMPGNEIKVVLKNEGLGHVQVTDFALYIPGGSPAIATEIRSSYVMAGQRREWLLKPDSSREIIGGFLHLKAYTDAGEIDVELRLEGP